LTFQDASNGVGEFRLPRSVQPHESVYAPEEQPQQFLIAAVFSWEQNQEFAPRRLDAAPLREAAQVRLHGTRIQEENSGSAAVVHRLRFAGGMQQGLNRQILYVRENLFYRAGKDGV
jgi:hypothetical protein